MWIVIAICWEMNSLPFAREEVNSFFRKERRWILFFRKERRWIHVARPYRLGRADFPRCMWTTTAHKPKLLPPKGHKTLRRRGPTAQKSVNSPPPPTAEGMPEHTEPSRRGPWRSSGRRKWNRGLCSAHRLVRRSLARLLLLAIAPANRG